MKLKNMVALISGIVIIGLTSTANAGKPERDKIDELTPTITSTQASVKETCSCDIKISVKWDSFPTADSMLHIKNTLQEFDKALKNQCDNDVNKQALCSNLSDLEVNHAADGGKPTLEGKIIKATLGPVAFPSASNFREIVSKF